MGMQFLYAHPLSHRYPLEKQSEMRWPLGGPTSFWHNRLGWNSCVKWSRQRRGQSEEMHQNINSRCTHWWNLPKICRWHLPIADPPYSKSGIKGHPDYKVWIAAPCPVNKSPLNSGKLTKIDWTKSKLNKKLSTNLMLIHKVFPLRRLFFCGKL